MTTDAGRPGPPTRWVRYSLPSKPTPMPICSSRHPRTSAVSTSLSHSAVTDSGPRGNLDIASAPP